MEDTIFLLKECSSGCIMAQNSIKQVMEYVEDADLLKLLHGQEEKHEELEKEIAQELDKLGKNEKEPGVMASAMSWFGTEMKMMLRDDAHQAAKIMMDGCHMGIQSISEYLNKYKNAEEHSRKLAQNIITIEEEFMKELRKYM